MGSLSLDSDNKHKVRRFQNYTAFSLQFRQIYKVVFEWWFTLISVLIATYLGLHGE